MNGRIAAGIGTLILAVAACEEADLAQAKPIDANAAVDAPYSFDGTVLDGPFSDGPADVQVVDSSSDAGGAYTITVSQIETMSPGYLPLGEPGHAGVSLYQNGKFTAWPAGTTFEAKATSPSECVYAKAFGSRIFMFAQYSCDEAISVRAILPASHSSQVLAATLPMKTYAESAKRTRALIMVDDAAVLPKKPPIDYFSNASPLAVGSTGGAYMRITYDTKPMPLDVVVYPEELTSVTFTGSAISGTSPSALKATAAGTSTVTAAVELPRLGLPADPFRVEATSSVKVIEPQPLTSLYGGWIEDYVSSLAIKLTDPCRFTYLMGVYGSGVSQYMKRLAWSDATLKFADSSFATLNQTTGELCALRPGGTTLSMTLGNITKEQFVTVYPDPQDPITVRIDPASLAIKAPRAAGGCVGFKVYSKVGALAEEDVSASPILSLRTEAASLDAGFFTPWATCKRAADAGALECCAPADGTTTPRTATNVVVSYVNSSANAPLTQP